MIAASKNLCEEFYELTGIKPPMMWAQSAYSGEWQVVPDEHYTRREYPDEPGAGEFYNHKPAYDLDFLVTLAPLPTGNIEDNFMFGRHPKKPNIYTCVWRDIVSDSDKPADAVIVLLINAAKREAAKQYFSQGVIE